MNQVATARCQMVVRAPASAVNTVASMRPERSRIATTPGACPTGSRQVGDKFDRLPDPLAEYRRQNRRRRFLSSVLARGVGVAGQEIYPITGPDLQTGLCPLTLRQRGDDNHSVRHLHERRTSE